MSEKPGQDTQHVDSPAESNHPETDRQQAFRYPPNKQLAAVIKENDRRRRRERVAEKMRSSLIYWFFSAQADEPGRMLNSRSTLDRGKYERFRAFVSWTNIARLQSSYAVKLGLAGLVFAPLIATAFLHVPYLRSFGFPKQFGFLFLSGLSFVLSSVVFRLRCPALLLEIQSGRGRTHDSPRRNDLLEALVSMEFAKLVTWRHYPADLARQFPDRPKELLI